MLNPISQSFSLVTSETVQALRLLEDHLSQSGQLGLRAKDVISLFLNAGMPACLHLRAAEIPVMSATDVPVNNCTDLTPMTEKIH